MFARLFGPDDDQVLLMLRQGDEGKPEVAVYFQPEVFGVCWWAISFEDDENGWKKAEACLRDLTEAEARRGCAEFAVLLGRLAGESEK
jgi:hypothetical protein